MKLHMVDMPIFRRLVLGLVMALGAPSTLAHDPLVDTPLLTDPFLARQEGVKVFNPRLKEVLAWSLEQPDADSQRRGALALAEVYAAGLKELTDMTPRIAQLMDPLGSSPQNPAVRLAAAQALIQMDARQFASVLWAHNQSDGLDMILLTDPALAVWNHEPAKDTWRLRLADPQALRAVRLSAIESVRVAKYPEAIDALRKLVTDKTLDDGLRLASAKAMGANVDKGLEPLAGELGGSSSSAERQMAVAVMSSHTSNAAIEALLRLALDGEPAVAGAALGRLLEIDPLLVKPIAPGLLTNDDPTVRYLTAKAVFAQRTPEAIKLVAPLLDDPSPEVRVFVRNNMIESDHQPQLSAEVRAAGMKAIQTDGWRGAEQGAFVLGKLDHKPAAPGFLKLLTHQRPETRLAAATALRWLAIPQTLPAVLAHVGDITRRKEEVLGLEGMHREKFKDQREEAAAALARGEGSKAVPPPNVDLLVRTTTPTDAEFAQHMQMFGLMRHQPADPLMRQYVPKHSMPWNQARAAAIWALGYLHEGKPDEELVTAFCSRAMDNNPLDPESIEVRKMATVSLARMKAVSAIPTLRALYAMSKKESVEMTIVSRWAIKQLTGEELPPIPVLDDHQTGYFLEPLP